ncbi:V/A-type H+-transporting ATPase subunit G/H [Clostridium amylolyticum]|uniref:V/A-type H+-transporting ATPase subunit G/H n=1 Tax=Clostridium amylolyticum TaxID=1121298 RepID=A0A1M6MPJ0_9CLOT|nr:hypothetical protein [Clostridium amylolyticum]SHJ85398.1 V/A-type H+-transporting ATPase subunit G/H [Clostridium amylolyticum]
MALEAINEIRKAEEEADLLIKNAQEESREIIKQGNLKAEMSYDEIIKSAKSQSDNYFKKAETEGNLASEPILKLGREETEELLNVSQEKLQQAVKLVVERIVKNYGHN